MILIPSMTLHNRHKTFIQVVLWKVLRILTLFPKETRKKSSTSPKNICTNSRKPFNVLKLEMAFCEFYIKYKWSDQIASRWHAATFFIVNLFLFLWCTSFVILKLNDMEAFTKGPETKEVFFRFQDMASNGAFLDNSSFDSFDRWGFQKIKSTARYVSRCRII